MKPCHACGHEHNHASATRCRECGERFVYETDGRYAGEDGGHG